MRVCLPGLLPELHRHADHDDGLLPGLGELRNASAVQHDHDNSAPHGMHGELRVEGVPGVRMGSDL